MSGTAAPTDVRTQVLIGGKSVPMTEFQITSGTYGSVGHATMHTSLQMMKALNIDMVELSSNQTVVPVAIYAAAGSVPTTQIFDGDVLETEWLMDQDTVVVHARDHAGIFVDQKRILARDAKALTEALSPLSPGQTLNPSGVATMNRKVSQVVTDIAQEFGYKPVLNMGGSDVLSGAAWGGSDHTYMTIPQNLWSILNTLARDTGNEVYTTPKRELVFGTPGAGLETLNLTWGLFYDPQAQGDKPHPVANLRITHNPRRNGTFRVLVFSYMASGAQATIGRATFIGSNLATPELPEGLRTGSAAKEADKQLLNSAKTKGLGSASDLSHVQLYTFHWDGLSNDDADSRAGAIATDIAKRLMMLKCWIDGFPPLLPTQPFIMGGPLPKQFASNQWYVSGFQHKFKMPTIGRQGSAGLITEIQALDLPAVSLGQGLK